MQNEKGWASESLDKSLQKKKLLTASMICGINLNQQTYCLQARE